MRRFKNTKLAIATIVLLTFFSGCFPDEDIPLVDLDIIITEHDESIDFSTYGTYSIPGEVVKVIDGEGVNGMPSEFDETVLARIKANMNALGYTEELDPSSNPPDLLLLAVAQQDDLLEFSTFPFWDWFDWWDGWFPNWGFNSEWSGVRTDRGIARRYDAGTLFIYMMDPNNANDQEMEAPILWRAVINGLILPNVNDQARTTENVNKAFAQSPYLGAN